MALTAHMVTIDCGDPRGLDKFWTQAAGYEIRADLGGEYVVVGPASGDGIRLGLQRVPEPRVGKNRVHVDWAADDRSAEVSRLVALGASVIASHAVPGLTWTVLADPEGNEFCVSAHE
ncbi:MAG TPA: VOC family protein [Micromonosporaceae bacterium]|jgi:predicted enzyme related to lactoylglutathione lyase